MHVCVWEGKKRNPLQDSTAYQSWVGFLFFQFMQDIFVLFARSRDKAALFHMKPSQLLSFLPHFLSCELDPTSRWHQEAGVGTFSLHYDGVWHGPTQFAGLHHSYGSEDISSIFISQVGRRWNGNPKRNATGLILVFPQRIKKPLTNCWRFICLNLHCGSCLIHRAWKSFFFHRNNLQPPDFKNQYYHKVGFTPNKVCQNPHLILAGNTIKKWLKKKKNLLKWGCTQS